MPSIPTGEQLLATILKHDSKTTSYKFALLRALNDVVLGHPDLALTGNSGAAAGHEAKKKPRLVRPRLLGYNK